MSAFESQVMEDRILESIFLDDSLWAEVIDRGADKGIPGDVLQYFQDPHGRAELCGRVASGEYSIRPPHTGYRPKDDGGERVFLANEPMDRVFLTAVYKWLARNMGDAVHPSCTSYTEGIGTGAAVKRLSGEIVRLGLGHKTGIVGRKLDIHHYFDSVTKRDIHNEFDKVERRFGRSSVIDVLRKYYDSDVYYDSRLKAYVERPMGVKQGCAVSAWLANVLLYSLDKRISGIEGCYMRYSDDIIYVGEHYGKVTALIRRHLRKMGLSLNDSKTEDIYPDRFVRFLGYDIRGGEITLSRKWVKFFQSNVDRRTVLDKRLIDSVRRIRKKGGRGMEEKLDAVLVRAQKSLTRFLYYGNGEYSWASSVLPVINRKEDISELNKYCLDALRAVYTGKTSIGSLGKSSSGGIRRGTGRNVAANRKATDMLSAAGRPPGWLSGFLSVEAMRRSITNRMLYRTLAQNLLENDCHPLYGRKALHEADGGALPEVGRDKTVAELERRYDNYLNSRPDGRKRSRFYAKPLEQMTVSDLISGMDRKTAGEELECYLADYVREDDLFPDAAAWYWQSDIHPQLVLLRSWFCARSPHKEAAGNG